MPSTVNPPLVELRHLSFGYGESPVLNDVSMRIPRGKVTALIGPMGGGKSTTLRLDVDNLFDETYYTNSFSALWVQPGTPRSARVAASFKF